MFGPIARRSSTFLSSARVSNRRRLFCSFTEMLILMFHIDMVYREANCLITGTKSTAKFILSTGVTAPQQLWKELGHTGIGKDHRVSTGLNQPPEPSPPPCPRCANGCVAFNSTDLPDCANTAVPIGIAHTRPLLKSSNRSWLCVANCPPLVRPV